MTALDLPRMPAWMAQGLCGQVDADAWFAEKGGTTQAVKRICNDCPVTELCLAYALENGERFGVWGGASERERRAMSKAIPTTDERRIA